MKKISFLTIAAALTIGAAACSSNDEAAPAVAEPGSADTTSALERAEPTKSALDTLSASGTTCKPGTADHRRDCALDGSTFTIELAAAAETEPLRRQACEQGYVNSELQMLSGDGWTIVADDSDTLPMIQKVVGGDVVKYCP